MFFWLTIILSAFVLSTAFADDGEVVPADEGGQIEKILQLLEAPSKVNPELEHRKIHGCVSGEFSLLNIWEPNLAQGLFARGSRSFVADVRFANASLRRVDDRLNDTRSIAIKLYNVSGDHLLAEAGQEETQDFVLANEPMFFVSNVEEFLSYELAEHSSGFNGLSLWSLYHSRTWPIYSRSENQQSIVNPLEAHYWSQVPSKYGSTQAKFSLETCVGFHYSDASTGPDRLRENLAAGLKEGPACFDFRVQLRTHPERQPIEDANSEWLASDSQFVSVARLWINKQEVRTGPACEALEFSPWHALKDHRPLGGISRLRKAVIESTLRKSHVAN